MAVEIRVPDLGESVVDVTVLKWHKQPGDSVEEGDVVVELETDKANVEVPAPSSGFLESISIQEGESASVGDLLGTITETPSQAREPSQPEAPQEREAVSPQAAHHTEVQPKATPSVRRLAEELGIDISKIEGSGAGGRITREDVLAMRQAPSGAQQAESRKTVEAQPIKEPPPAPSEAPARELSELERRERMSTRRRVIARRLVEAQHTAAMLTTFNECDMSNVIEIRRRLGPRFQEKYGVKLGFMSFFTKAVVAALKEFPYLNAEIDGEDIILKYHYDIGIAVGAKEGLVVPVIRNADRKSFAEIEKEIDELATKVRNNTISLEEVRGGTFTITNGGIYGSLLSTPILNPPQVGILGMHAIKERPVVVEGQVVVRPMMYLALTYDHRIVDGSDAVRFLVRIKELIEDPTSLMLES